MGFCVMPDPIKTISNKEGLLDSRRHSVCWTMSRHLSLIPNRYPQDQHVWIRTTLVHHPFRLLRALSKILVPQRLTRMATRITDASRTNMEGTVAVTSIMQVMVEGVAVVEETPTGVDPLDGYTRVGLE